MSNILKRKNEDDAEELPDQLSKRMALDGEQLAVPEAGQEPAQTALKVEDPELGNGAESDEQPKTPAGENENNNINDSPQRGNLQHDVRAVLESLTPELAAGPTLNGLKPGHLLGPEPVHLSGPEPAHLPPQPPRALSEVSAETYSQQGTSKQALGHHEKDDPDHVSLRMLCPVKEAGIVVGKKGERITHIREKANVRVNVSENLKNVPERVITVKGLAENAARAFGLITRTILDEPEDEPALMMSKQYVLKLLVPHPVVGFVIGRSGLKFREIEDNSAAKLKAAEQPLPYSTDRVLSVSGVADAIHIAVYYISQALLEHKDSLKKNKVIYYNPVNFRPQPSTANPMMNMPMNGPHGAPNMPYMAPAPLPIPAMGPMKDHVAPQPYQHKPYDFQMMFQPTARPQYNGPLNLPSNNVPPQNLYTDEHGNNIIGDVITGMPVQISTAPDRFTQDVFVANTNIGSVIGKGGNNIKQIRESSGCLYVKIEPDQHQLILLGGGRGLTSIRKLTLTGAYPAIQTAIYFINQRISTDKERNGVR